MNLEFYNPEKLALEFNPRRTRKILHEWSALDLALLQENFLDRTDGQLAIMLRVGFRELKRKIRELKLRRPRGNAGRPPKPKVEKPPKVPKEKKPREEKIKVKDRVITSAVVERRSLAQDYHEKRKRALAYDRSKYKTRQVDYSKMISVRIDSKTVIFIGADEDPDKAIEKFLSVNREYMNKEYIRQHGRDKNG